MAHYKKISSQVNFEILSHEKHSVTFRRILAKAEAGKARNYKNQKTPKVVIECFSGARLVQLKKARILSLEKQKKKSSVLRRIMGKLKIEVI